MLVHAKKPLRFSNQVTTYPLIEEQENIELDSLENGEESEMLNEDQNIIASSNNGSRTLKYLNLNGLCKNSKKKSESYVEEIVLAEESVKSLCDIQALSLRSNGIHNFPTSILQLTSLTVLDISDNELLTLPPEIDQLFK
ncbi:hypothetical protein HHI36_005224 [Cryptolaemus montrouzieri]|uniref:Uncharacterized protein n=1 Tax=Cryptolaemus montrouzieri TaxID=559131 RepID=A0ABD2NTG5_9CUCU